LPEAEEPIEPAQRPPPSSTLVLGNETLLLAEDDDLVRYLSVAGLASSGYRVIEAVHGAEALKATRQHRGPIHLLITDISMPQMDGIELSRHFRELRPEAGVLYISAHGADEIASLGGASNVLQKPFSTETLLRRVRQALEERLPFTGRAVGGLGARG
jgi:CheY-like chemotaxis protein